MLPKHIGRRDEREKTNIRNHPKVDGRGNEASVSNKHEYLAV
jgi:hypothetical protein